MRTNTIAAKVIEGFYNQGWKVIGSGGTWAKAMRPLKDYIDCKVERAVKAEREACAKVCEDRYMGDNNREDMEAKRCAATIRARGEPVQEITDTNRLDWLDTLPCGITIHGDSSFPQSQSATPKTSGTSHIRDLIDSNRSHRGEK